MAAHLHLTDDEIVEAMEAGHSYWPLSHSYWPLSLDRPHSRSGENIDVQTSDDAIERVTDLDNLAAAIPQLPDLERFAVQRYFFEERTQHSIANELGISQLQVSRLISRAVSYLRESFVDL